MFDANIQYYAYDNVEGDEFGVGYLGNKEFWIHLINGWHKQDNDKTRVHSADFEELTPEDMRGCVLAEIVPDDRAYDITWLDKKGEECSARIEYDDKITVQNVSSIPRWINRLKNQLRDTQN